MLKLFLRPVYEEIILYKVVLTPSLFLRCSKKTIKRQLLFQKLVFCCKMIIDSVGIKRGPTSGTYQAVSFVILFQDSSVGLMLFMWSFKEWDEAHCIVFLKTIYESSFWAIFVGLYVTGTWNLWKNFLYMNLWKTPSCWYYRYVMTCNWNLFCWCCYFLRRGPSWLFCKALQGCPKSICWTIENEICMYKMIYFCMN